MTLPDSLLMQVEKPARYIGQEINMTVKDLQTVDIRFAFCFPDVYEVGMSHLGMQILYYFLNERKDTYCERMFAPWMDMEKLMRRERLKLFALETKTPMDQFDFLGFTLQYEMSYTNIINMLDLGGVPIFARDRGDNHPIVCAGGPCAYNPEPLADFIDFFYIGEGEVMLAAILDRYLENKKQGGSRGDFLESLLSLQGVYVPCYYQPEYSEEGTLSSFIPLLPAAPKTIKKVFLQDVDTAFYPDKQLVPLMEAIHDRVALEVFRGCIRGCRFCQAGFVNRPLREKNDQTLIGQAEKILKNTGHDEISLVSLSTGDYSGFQPLAQGLLERFSREGVNISLPSLRIDAFHLELMQKVQEVRKSSLTFAPEAGSQRLRDVINKNITEEEILAGCGLAFGGGWNRVKLYFMIGLPTETREDLIAAARLCEKIVEEYYRNGKRSRPPNIVVSLSCFVPKPFTPFQWEAQQDAQGFRKGQFLVKDSIQKRQIKVNYHSPELSLLEGVLARGDRRVSQVIYRAWELGARFDGWTEHFHYDVWKQAFEESEQTPDISFYTSRERSLTELLPWDHIDTGVDKDFLKRERARAMEGLTTPNCRQACAGCGLGAECQTAGTDEKNFF